MYACSLSLTISSSTSATPELRMLAALEDKSKHVVLARDPRQSLHISDPTPPEHQTLSPQRHGRSTCATTIAVTMLKRELQTKLSKRRWRPETVPSCLPAKEETKELDPCTRAFDHPEDCVRVYDCSYRDDTMGKLIRTELLKRVTML